MADPLSVVSDVAGSVDIAIQFALYDVSVLLVEDTIEPAQAIVVLLNIM